MGYVLFWLESLAVSLLFVATLAACIARLQRRWLRWTLLTLVALVPLGIYLGLTVPLGWFVLGQRVAIPVFYPLVAVTLFYAAGAVGILIAGQRRKGEELALPRAAGWPRGKLAIALGVAIGLHLMTFWNLDLAVRQRLATLRAEAGALALSLAPVQVPDRDNAAILFEQAVGIDGVPGAMGRDSWPETWQGKWDEEWTNFEEGPLDPQDPDLKAFLKRQAPVIALLHEAAEKPGCYFDRDYARPSIDMLVPEIGRMRRGAELLAIDARVQAAKGNMRGALEDVNAMFAVAGHAASDPLLICVLVAVTIDDMAAETLQAVLVNGQATAEDFEALTIDPSFSFRRHFHRAFRMEEAFGLSMLCTTGEGSVDGCCGRPSVPSLAMAPFRVFFLNSEVPGYQRIMKKCNYWAASPYYKVKSCWDDLDEELREERAGVFAAMLVPAWSDCAEAVARGDAVRQNVQLAAAMMKYRAKHGRYPEKLDELVPEFIPAVPIDPFDGKPMKLAQTERGPVVYSIGPNMEDDGGMPLGDDRKTGDITFQLPK